MPETTHSVETVAGERAGEGASSDPWREPTEQEYQAARSPRSAGIAGVLFAILFTVSITILYLAVSGTPDNMVMWLTRRILWVRIAIALVPFAGICFLWFIGVVRARLGRFEDQFFSTVFLGSGLLFLAMIFVATAVAGSMVLGYERSPGDFGKTASYYLARDIVTQIFSIFALRMAAVFLMSQGTLWLRTKVMPRWLAFVTFAASLVLLFIYRESYWAVLVFPVWVFLVSVYVLIVRMFLDGRRAAREGAATARRSAGESLQGTEAGDG